MKPFIGLEIVVHGFLYDSPFIVFYKSSLFTFMSPGKTLLRPEGGPID